MGGVRETYELPLTGVLLQAVEHGAGILCFREGAGPKGLFQLPARFRLATLLGEDLAEVVSRLGIPGLGGDGLGQELLGALQIALEVEKPAQGVGGRGV